MTPPTPCWFSRSVISRSDSEVARRSRISWPTSGRVWLEKAWMPGRASPIAPFELAPCCARRERSVCAQVGDQRPAVAVEHRVGGAGELADPVGGVAGLADRDPRLGQRRGDLRRALGERAADLLEIVEDAGDRFLVAVGEQFGEPLGQRRDPFEQLRRGVEQLAERARLGRDDRHAIGAFATADSARGRRSRGAAGAPGPASALGGGSSWICETPVKPTPRMVAVVPSRTGVSSLDGDPDADELRAVAASRLIDSIWPTGTPEKVTRRALGEALDRLLKKMSYFFSPPPETWLSQTTNSDQGGDQPQHDAADEDLVRTGFHQALGPFPSQLTASPRRGRAAP